MREITVMNVYDLPTAGNICNQTLREVMSLDKVSFAHVAMNPRNVSLLHQHLKMHEIYFILEGQGILYYGKRAVEATKGTYLVLPPETPHKLRNVGDVPLEHLVFATPSFDPRDVHLIPDNRNEPKSRPIDSYRKLVTALDGARVYELLSPKDRNELGLGMAFASLQPKKEATLHYHQASEEVYYVISGRGKITVNEKTFAVKKGSVIYIPTKAVHGLQNTINKELEILCLSSPTYTDEDFIFME